ncbi:DUF1636 domain-containing protein [Phaeobacter sp. HF9A]|uniref:DUF1636 family protein n=1 Tax=Phaeobacter sp. HF9A TaxID=2721561 RepID=UPI00142FF5E4|nr:DUF1636 domain-containing protein [Phaeobacter sp. HF9A]NIZ14910.1 DUF1636 domain-containing protein [Phaeobacter sp. HF9A]
MADTRDQSADPVVVTVCTTCRPEGADPEAIRPGRILAERLLGAELPEGVQIRGVECLSACSRSCALHLSGGAERWSYVYGDLDPDTHLDEILAGVSAYSETSDGFVPWRQRPVVFRKQSIARIPPVSMPSVELTAASAPPPAAAADTSPETPAVPAQD